MLLRRRLDMIENAAGVFRCPHCQGPVARLQPIVTDEERAERLVELCNSVLAERQEPGDANTGLLPAETETGPDTPYASDSAVTQRDRVGGR
jgi:hypothetical protein